MYDVIIIGQGIAGTILSYYLEQEKAHYLVIDYLNPSSASRVAAGLYNPVSFKRINPVLQANEIFMDLEKFYQGLENYCDAKFLHPIGILKYLSGEYEKNEWCFKADQYPQFISTEIIPKFENFGKVKYSGFINMPVFLSSYRNKLISSQKLLNESIDYQNIKANNSELSLRINEKEYLTKKLIFCEGYQIRNNPFFNHRTLSPTKGEVLRIKTDQEIFIPSILHKSGFVVPLSNNEFLAGTTYDRDDLSLEPTKLAKESISEVFEALIPNTAYSIIDHKASLRPNTRNRMPIFEAHPSYKNMFVLNGLGSRGIAIAPKFIKEQLSKVID